MARSKNSEYRIFKNRRTSTPTIKAKEIKEESEKFKKIQEKLKAEAMYRMGF